MGSHTLSLWLFLYCIEMVMDFQQESVCISVQPQTQQEEQADYVRLDGKGDRMLSAGNLGDGGERVQDK